MEILFAFMVMFLVSVGMGEQISGNGSMITSDYPLLNRFPKVIWTYWDNGIENANLFTQLCVQNMNRTAEKHGWQLRVLSSSTFSKYIVDNARFKDIVQNAKVPIGLPKKADIIRLMLLYHHGGVWIDTNTFFIQDLNWLENIEKQVIIDNKFGQYPEVLMFSYQNVQGDLRIQFRENTQNEKVLLCPQNEIWFMAAMPKTQLFHDWLNQFQLYIKEGFEFVEKKNSMEGTLISYFHYKYGKDYLFANRALQSILQLKQKQINKQKQKQKEKEKEIQTVPKYAVNYYKIWTIQSRDSGYYLMNQAKRLPVLFLQYLTQYTEDEMRDSIGMGRYFIKLNAPFYQPINGIIQPDLSFNEFMASDLLITLGSLAFYTCDAELSLPQSRVSLLPKQFVVKDSILYKYLLKESKLPKVKDIQIFNKEEIIQKCKINYQKYIKIVVFFIPLLLSVSAIIICNLRVIYLCLVYIGRGNKQRQQTRE